MQNKQFSVDLLEKLGFSTAYIPDVSEDCLYLNIYTPAKRSHDTKLPVRNFAAYLELCCSLTITFGYLWIATPKEMPLKTQFLTISSSLCWLLFILMYCD